MTHAIHRVERFELVGPYSLALREREEDSLFESSEIFSQVVYIVYNYASRCKCVLSGDRTEDLTWRGTVPRDQRSLSPQFHGVSRRPIHLFSGP